MQLVEILSILILLVLEINTFIHYQMDIVKDDDLEIKSMENDEFEAKEAEFDTKSLENENDTLFGCFVEE